MFEYLSEMLVTEWLTVIAVVAIIYVILSSFLDRPKNLPPGPTGLPLFGYLPFMMRSPEKKLFKLAEKYGDVVFFNGLGLNFVLLSSYDAVKNLFSQTNEVIDRPPSFFHVGSPSSKWGVIFSTGETWARNRRFLFHTLRDFGLGQHSLNERVQEVANDVMKEIDKLNGQPFDIYQHIYNFTVNVVCSITFNRRFKIEDPMFHALTVPLQKMARDIPTFTIFLYGPVTRCLPLHRLSSVNNFIKDFKTLDEKITEIIKDHQNTFDPTFHRDIVDAFIGEMNKNSTSPDGDVNQFDIDHLKGLSVDLFMAGTETTASTIYWIIRFLFLYPEIQEKIQSEIDEVIGRERTPSSTDRAQMPFTEATIHEVFRLSSVVSFGIFHRNSKKMKYRNFEIPKDTIFIPNVCAIHNDPKYWNQPEKFDPTRFLDSEGKFMKKESLIPFSIGKRNCIGENLARLEIFIFLILLLQRFTILKTEDSDVDLKYDVGIIRNVSPFKMRVCKRS